ncbi:MAG: hypothetical protein ACFFFG_02215 [Candidatus Thorarchaeota archaeon]
MALHPPAVHFPIGAWFVTTLTLLMALWINFFQKRGIIDFESRFGKNIVSRLDFVAHVCGIIGLVGVLPAIYLGLIDASGIINPNPLDINVALLGLTNSFQDDLLTIKVIGALVGMQLFIIAGVLRFIVVTVNHSDIYETRTLIQVLYGGSTFVGFGVILLVGAVGGIIVYDESLLETLPFIDVLIYEAEITLIPILMIIAIVFTFMLIISVFLFKQGRDAINSTTE